MKYWKMKQHVCSYTFEISYLKFYISHLTKSEFETVGTIFKVEALEIRN